MIPICHSAVRGPVVLLLAILCLALFSAPETKAAQGTKLNSYLSSKVEKVLQSSNSIEEARSGLEKEFRTTRAQHGSLAPLCDYLRDRTENAMAKPLLAVTLAADKQYEAAIDLLTEMAADPGTNAWALAELASVTKMMDIQQTWDLLGGLGQPVVLSTDEKQRINEILELSPSEARIAIKEACRDLVATYGDLAPLIDYLESLDEGPLRDKTLATVLIANGNIHDAVKILAYQAASPAVDPWTLVELGRATEMLGQPTEALTHFERALQASDEPDVHFALTIRIAQLYYESDQPDEAGQALSELLQSEPNIPTESRNFCARIAGLHGDHEFVAEHFQATGEGKELRLNHLYLGETMLQLGRWAEARKQFESALPLAKLARDRRYVIDRIISAARPMNALPQLIDEWLGSEALTAEQLDIVFGLLAGEMGRLDSVFSLFEREDLPPQAREFLESPEFQERLAAFAIEADNFEQAAQTYRDLITRYPDEPSYRDGYVRLLLLEGDRTAARNVYREAMVGTSEPGELMRIAAGARRVGLKAEAIDAAARAGEFRKKSPLEAGLFMASLHSELSENDKALEILRQLEHDIEQNPGDSDADDLMALSDAFERLGYQLDAVRMCRKAVEMEDSERYLRKLISMVERQGKDEEAFILWRKLWDSAEEPMTIIQAKDRLLELGSRNGKLADIALELEDRIGRGELREREVTLLLDIYTSVGDPVSAADVIMELSDAQGGESIATYERLLQVYIESELFGRCKRILRKLIEIDPENRDEHLQLLAIIALERNNKGDAMVVLEELAGRSEDGIFSDSFSASVLKMLGKPAEAALA
ncbi:MAG: tetratricopeptide repeat protein, partial [Opitutales bacterium]